MPRCWLHPAPVKRLEKPASDHSCIPRTGQIVCAAQPSALAAAPSFGSSKRPLVRSVILAFLSACASRAPLLGDMLATEVAVRFRHTQGVDIGPFAFPLSATAISLKERLFQEWPQEGPLGAERPGSVAEIKLICAGKFLDNNTVLGSLHHVLGEPGSDTIVTMHVVLRPPEPQKAPAPKQQTEQSKGCCCVQ